MWASRIAFADLMIPNKSKAETPRRDTRARRDALVYWNLKHCGKQTRFAVADTGANAHQSFVAWRYLAATPISKNSTLRIVVITGTTKLQGS
jgi:hypothetical protein